MKHIIRNIVLGAVVLAWTGFAQAEDAAPAGSPKKGPPKAEKMQCEIVKVDAVAKTIEVKTADKTETLALSDKCKVKINGVDKKLSDLKAGDAVTCTVYDKKDGTKSVGRIIIGEEPAKAPKKKSE